MPQNSDSYLNYEKVCVNMIFNNFLFMDLSQCLYNHIKHLCGIIIWEVSNNQSDTGS